MSNKQPKLAGHWSVTVKLYDNSTASLTYSVYDLGRRKVIPVDLGIVEQPARMPFRPSELLVMAACEWLARDLEADEQARM